MLGLLRLSRRLATASTAAPQIPTTLQYAKFRRNSRRVGLIAEKIGLINMYDEHGKWHLLTIVRVADCHVVQLRTEVAKQSKMGFMNIQVGARTKKLKNATLPEVGHCAKAGLPPKVKLIDFRVTADALIPIGTRLTALHFIPGQLVDITATSKGKGFAGVMKRYGFSGQPASHGVSKSHRGMGSTGQCQDPGKVWPGKKMPGRMGGNRVTQNKMQIVRIDPVRDLIYIRGTIPGAKGSFLTIRDAWLARQPTKAPFPTHIPSDDDPKEDLTFPLATRNYYDPESQTRHPEKELIAEGDEEPSVT